MISEDYYDHTRLCPPAMGDISGLGILCGVFSQKYNDLLGIGQPNWIVNNDTHTYSTNIGLHTIYPCTPLQSHTQKRTL